ncbi:hypothetical protein AOT42_01945 [Corynebacterium diphtheriae bv. gravis]|uniref:Uncharacterized protein n=1 Tax=Corynebacterium diphtheriae bv. gravis TaxID=1720349 RepID=A0AAX0J4D9_CORDP|nr:hypothetical protein AOT42_01945 [Corynebacterium diphtheriae bv. gravis]
MPMADPIQLLMATMMARKANIQKGLVIDCLAVLFFRESQKGQSCGAVWSCSFLGSDRRQQ